MIINFGKLVRLFVYTESGIKLGRVYDFELDVESHNVARYLVKPGFFSTKNFLIQASQIKEITNDRMVVYDSAVKSGLSPIMGEAVSE